MIAREPTQPKIEALCNSRDGQVDVVIYATSRVFSEAFREMVVRLTANPDISSVALRQHPGAARSLDDLLEDTGIALLKDFPTTDHVAIVGNSSVAIELIAQGIPVYQVFDFDPVERDYYGFVRNGLTHEVTLDQLSDRFWTPYVVNEAWRAALVKWLPDMPSSEADTKAFQAAMAQINGHKSSPSTAAPSVRNRRSLRKRIKSVVRRGLARHSGLARRAIRRQHRILTKLLDLTYRADAWLAGGRPAIGGKADKGTPRRLLAQDERARRRIFAIFSMSQSRHPVEWLAQAEALEVFEPMALIQAIDAMLHSRNPSISDVFEDADQPHWESAAGMYAYLKKLDWINAELPLSDIDRIAAFIEGSRFDDAIKKRLSEALFPLVIDCGTVEQLDHLLSRGFVNWQNLSLHRRFQLLRKLARAGRRAEVTRRIQEMKRTATPLEALKLRNFKFLSGWLDESWDHRDAEQSLVAVAPAGVAQDFQALVGPVYDRLRAHMRYMEIRVNAEQRAALLDRVQAAICSKREFSCIRLSDREGYLFAEHGRFTPSDVLNCENHWWGTELAPELRTQIVAEARAAVGTADVVGIPAIHRFIRDVSSNTPSLGATLQSRGLVEVLTEIRSLAAPAADFSEDKVNVGLFGDIDAVTRLASYAHRLIIVTSVRVDHLPAKLRAHDDLRHIELPPHYKTRLNKKYAGSEDILPQIYPRLIDKLDAVAEPGALVLIAGGLVGKIFVGRAKAKGAVVLDMGHVIDDWANNRLSALR